MKSIQGLLLAIGLGVVGAIFNWMYLHSGPSRDATVSFLGIKEGQTVNRGEVLRDEYLVELPLREDWVGKLRDFAVLYKDKATVVGQPVWRPLSGPCLVMSDDLKTPLEELKLEPDETAIFIPVDSRAFVPSLFKPGDTVSFMLPRSYLPTPAVPGMPPKSAPPHDPNAAESPVVTIGPFTILALGNRLGSLDVMKAAKMQPVQENVLAIRVGKKGSEEANKADQLWSLLQASNFRQVSIKLHSRNKDKS